jgi:DNA-binding MarR family transcriptional regulator
MSGSPDTSGDGMRSEIVGAPDVALGNFVQQAIQGRSQVAAAISLSIGLPLPSAALVLMNRLRIKPMRPTELAAYVGIKPSSLTKQIQELEAKGLVDRTTDEQDGRVSILRLTQFGEDSLAAAAEIKQSILRQVISGWSADQVEEFIVSLGRLSEDIDGGWNDFWVSRSSYSRKESRI